MLILALYNSILPKGRAKSNGLYKSESSLLCRERKKYAFGMSDFSICIAERIFFGFFNPAGYSAYIWKL